MTTTDEDMPLLPPKSVRSVSLEGVPSAPPPATKKAAATIAPLEIDSGGGDGGDGGGDGSHGSGTDPVSEQGGRGADGTGTDGRDSAVTLDEGGGNGPEADAADGVATDAADAVPEDCCVQYRVPILAALAAIGNNVGFVIGQLSNAGAAGIGVICHWMFALASPFCAAAATFFGWQALRETRDNTRNLKKDVATLKKDVTNLKEDMVTLKKGVANLKEDMVTLKKGVANLKENVATKVELKGMEDRIVDLFRQRQTEV